MSASYRVSYSSQAARELSHLPRETQQRIRKAVDDLATGPRPPGCKKLEGEMYRIRVGSYRVIYSISDEALFVLVLRIGHRGQNVYRALAELKKRAQAAKPEKPKKR